MARQHTQRSTGIGIVLLLMFGLLFAGVSTAAEPETGTFSKIDRYVEEQRDYARIPGVAVSVVDREQIVHSRGFGHSSNDQPVTRQTLFSIGSTTKSMTALAVMQLVEASQVELDAPVQEYIPWFRLADPNVSADLTVRHLLTMTSGIPAMAGGEAFRSTEAMTPEEAIRALQSAEFAHEPGSTFEYVNANYVILGHLIEVVSCQSYGDYVQEHIFDPLEMSDSYTDLAAARAAGFDPGHRYWFGQPVAHEMAQLPALVPAGYVISTADDLSHYLSMYLNDGVYNGVAVISAEGIAEMHRGVADAELGPWADGAPSKYAMGWYVGGPWDDGGTIFHPGSEPSFTAMLMLDREDSRGVVVIMNAATEMPFPGAAGAMRVLPAGVMSILEGEQPGTVGLGRFYLVFDFVVVAVVAVQGLALGRLIRRGVTIDLQPRTSRRTFRFAAAAVPLIWEFGLGIALLAMPGLAGLSWHSMRLWTPDLALVLMLFASLWLITGVYRAVLIGKMLWATYQGGAATVASPEAAEAHRPAV